MKLRVVSISLIAVAIASAAHAQETGAPASAEPQSEAGSVMLDDIVVTAQRRSENLQRTALAVSAVTGANLEAAGVSEAQNLTKLVPSLQIAPAAGLTQIYLRGVGTFGANAFAEQAVAFNVDGVYLSRPSAVGGVFFDLERIEVLKGPQGTLYGRNATGGAINVITRKPETGNASGSVALEVGNFNLVKGSGFVNLPVGDNSALRVATQIVDRDGYLSDGYDDEIGQAVRAQWLTKTGQVSILLSGDYYHRGGKGSGATVLPYLSDDPWTGLADPRITAVFPTLPLVQPPITARIPLTDGFNHSAFWGLSSTIDADFGFATLTFLPAYRRVRDDYRSFAAGYLIQIDSTTDQWSAEARLASNGSGPLKYVLGAYYFDESIDSRGFYDQGPQNTVIRNDLTTRSHAFFGQATYSLTETFRLTGGLRYTHERKTQASDSVQNVYVAALGTFIANAGKPVGDVSFNRATWKAGVEFDAGANSLIYASASTGFKGGGFYAGVGPNTFEPEILTAYTVGSKNRFAGGRLQLNIEAYHWRYKDQQITHLGPVATSATTFGPRFLTENAGQANIWGVEIDGLIRASRDDLFSFNLIYNHTKYGDFRYRQYSASGAVPNVACARSFVQAANPPTPAAIYAIDCSGRPLVNAPKWAANFGYDRTFAFSSGAKVVAAVSSRIEGSRYLGIEYLPTQRQGWYHMSDARISFTPAKGGWSVGAWINNIENEAVYSQATTHPVKTTITINPLRPPRTFGLRASLDF